MPLVLAEARVGGQVVIGGIFDLFAQVGRPGDVVVFRRSGQRTQAGYRRELQLDQLGLVVMIFGLGHDSQTLVGHREAQPEQEIYPAAVALQRVVSQGEAVFLVGAGKGLALRPDRDLDALGALGIDDLPDFRRFIDVFVAGQPVIDRDHLAVLVDRVAHGFSLQCLHVVLLVLR